MAAAITTRREHLMGTEIAIEVFDGSAPDRAVDEAFSWFRDVESRFSTFEEHSEVTRIGHGRLSIDDASPDVRHVLARCLEIEAATDGRFRIHPGQEDLPPLDPAGFVKGWSVDEAAMILRLAGVQSFLIDAGGDIRCVGHAPEGESWRVGVRDPDDPGRLAFVLRIPEGAVATSGTYFRGEHIWQTGAARDAPPSVTVVGPELGVADALATAIYAAGDEATTWMTRFPGYGALIVRSPGRAEWIGGNEVGLLDRPFTVTG